MELDPPKVEDDMADKGFGLLEGGDTAIVIVSVICHDIIGFSGKIVYDLLGLGGADSCSKILKCLGLDDLDRTEFE